MIWRRIRNSRTLGQLINTYCIMDIKWYKATWAIWGFKREKSGKNKNNVGVWRARMRLPLQHPSWISWEFDLWKWCWPSQKLWANCDSQLGLLIANKQLRNTCPNSIHTIQNRNMVWWPEGISNDALQTCTNKLQNSPHLQFATGIPPIWFNPDQKMPAKSGDKWQVQWQVHCWFRNPVAAAGGLVIPLVFKVCFIQLEPRIQ